MYDLWSGEGDQKITNERIRDALLDKISKEEIMKEMEGLDNINSLQRLIDNYDGENQKDVNKIEAAITLAGEIFESKPSEEIVQNMWFQWCTNYYNDDDYKIRSYQIAEDLMRLTGNDYKKILEVIPADHYYKSKECSTIYSVINDTYVRIRIPMKVLNFDNKILYMLDLSHNGKFEVSIGSGSRSQADYSDEIPINKLFVTLSKISSSNRSTGFVVKDELAILEKLDLDLYAEQILGLVWTRAKEITGIDGWETAMQRDNTQTILTFTYVEDARDALTNNTNQYIKQDPSDAEQLIYSPKGQYFIRKLRNDKGGFELVPFFK